MTDNSENDYSFWADRQPQIPAENGSAEGSSSPMPPGEAFPQSEAKAPGQSSENTGAEHSGASVYGPDFYPPVSNEAAQDGAPAQSRPENGSTPLRSIPYCEPAVFSPFEEPRAKRRKTGTGSRILKKGAGLIASAAVFGAVAAAAFFGFQELYYFLNPTARPGLAQDADDHGNPSGTRLRPIVSTQVAESASVTTCDVSDIVERSMPSLVSISCTFRSSTGFFGYLYEGTTEGSGSGIIVGENDRELLIATNNHVVDDALTTNITFPDGTVLAASVRGTDEAADLAIVSVPLSAVPAETRAAIRPAVLGSSDDMKVGQMVIAIGNALGYGQTTTVGYLSAREREVNVTDSATGKKTKLIALQVTAAINPGNSGGALLNTKGEVIGINTAKLSGTAVEGMGYAIPISSAADILDELMNREILSDEEKGYLGVHLSQSEITEEISALYGFPRGVFIADVVAGGAADRAGIVSGDIITAIDGSPVTARTQLQDKVNSYRAGTAVEVTLSRLESGSYTERTVTVILGSIADFD